MSNHGRCSWLAVIYTTPLPLFYSLTLSLVTQACHAIISLLLRESYGMRVFETMSQKISVRQTPWNICFRIPLSLSWSMLTRSTATLPTSQKFFVRQALWKISFRNPLSRDNGILKLIFQRACLTECTSMTNVNSTLPTASLKKDVGQKSCSWGFVVSLSRSKLTRPFQRRLCRKMLARSLVHGVL